MLHLLKKKRWRRPARGACSWEQKLRQTGVEGREWKISEVFEEEERELELE